MSIMMTLEKRDERSMMNQEKRLKESIMTQEENMMKTERKFMDAIGLITSYPYRTCTAHSPQVGSHHTHTLQHQPRLAPAASGGTS